MLWEIPEVMRGSHSVSTTRSVSTTQPDKELVSSISCFGRIGQAVLRTADHARRVTTRRIQVIQDFFYSRFPYLRLDNEYHSFSPGSTPTSLSTVNPPAEPTTSPHL